MNEATKHSLNKNIQTIKHRDLVIDLGDGVKTNAQLTFPTEGNGPFPAVLLVHGSGPNDMNETLAEDAKPLWQISLSDHLLVSISDICSFKRL
jgi:uncharacterized protein